MSDEPDRDRGVTSSPDGGLDRSTAAERYRKIFEHNNDAVMIVDLESESFVDVNPAASELLGYPREELLSMDPEGIHPEDIERVREEFISEVREEGSGFTDDLTCLTKEGREVPTEISGAALDPGGEEQPTRMVAMLRDISDRVEHRRELEETIERLDRFATVVSHDLRTPLSVIGGHVALARETGDPEHFEAIQDAVRRMDGMLSELLRLTRDGHVIGDRTDVDLARLAREVWNACGMDPATLAVESSLTVRADRSRLRELLMNLFENARTHAGPSVAVRVGSIGTGERRGFYVADDGDGIPDAVRDSLFEWGRTTAEDGTGFGLAIAAEVAEAHGWEIEARDSEAGGARFEITGV